MVQSEKKRLIDSYFRCIDELSKGSRAALKRKAGTMLSEADGKALVVFYQCLPYEITYRQDVWFAIGCMHCLWDAETRDRKPIEKAFSTMLHEESVSESVERRIISLLDMQWDDEGFFLAKLLRLMKLAKSRNVSVDCSLLLSDILSWDYEKRYVQHKWVRALYTDGKKGE